MDRIAIDRHISKQFNAELEEVRNRVMAMGGLAEKQIADALKALHDRDIDLAEAVIRGDARINELEVLIDQECVEVMVRRQPTASDLRLLVAVYRIIGDLERVGDKAKRIAKLAISLAGMDPPSTGYVELVAMGERVLAMLGTALDAFARMDAELALKTAKEDEHVDREYEGIVRHNLTFVMENATRISQVLNVIWVARALERVGDHSQNIAEHVIFLVKGKNVRHAPIEQVEQAVAPKS